MVEYQIDDRKFEYKKMNKKVKMFFDNNFAKQRFFSNSMFDFLSILE